MKKTNKLIMLLLTLSMLVSMSSFASFADDEQGQNADETNEITHVKDISPAYSQGLAIGDSIIRDEGTYGTGGTPIDAIKSGSVNYDGNGTLTLKGVTIEAPENAEEWCGIEAYGMDLTIILEGTNSITSNYRGIGLVGDDCSLNIKGNGKGNGTLTIEALYTGIYFNGNNGLTISDKATVTSKSTYHSEPGGPRPLESCCGVYSEKGSIVIKDSTVTAEGATSGIEAKKDVTEIIKSNVTTTGESVGVISRSDIEINDSTVTATGTDAICVIGGRATVNNSTVIATGDQIGIEILDGDLNVNKSTVTMAGQIVGIEAFYGDITINESIIDSTGGSYGIFAFGPDTTGDIIVSGASTRVRAKSGGIDYPEQIVDELPRYGAVVAAKSVWHGTTEINLIDIRNSDGLLIVAPENGIVVSGKKTVSDEGTVYYAYIADANKNVATEAVIEAAKPIVPAEPLMATVKAKGKKGVKVTWNAMTGADGYDIFFARCNTKKKKYTCKKAGNVASGKPTSWSKSGLKKGVPYKVYVKAYVMKDGKKTYIAKSPTVHAFTNGGSKKYTNPKSIKVKTSASVNVGKTYKLKPSVTKLKKGKKLINTNHAPKLRYLSSDTSVATVSKSGKIKGVAAGNCKVYVLAANGVKKAVKVTVK